MFVQVIKGRTRDAAALRRQLERWRTELKPGAIGFEGSTAGVADDGTVIVIARFTDRGAAEKNADRAEQTAWWEETARSFEGEPVFRESTDTDTILGGGSDSAGFVQVMEGRVVDRKKAQAFEAEMLDDLQRARPDLIGSHRVWFDDGSYVEAAYFTSEDEARKGEQSADFAGPQEEYMRLFGEMTFIDLREPIFD